MLQKVEKLLFKNNNFEGMRQTKTHAFKIFNTPDYEKNSS